MEGQTEELLLDYLQNKANLLKMCRDRIQELDEELMHERAGRQALEFNLKEARRQEFLCREELGEFQHQINALLSEKNGMEQDLKIKELQ